MIRKIISLFNAISTPNDVNNLALDDQTLKPASCDLWGNLYVKIVTPDTLGDPQEINLRPDTADGQNTGSNNLAVGSVLFGFNDPSGNLDRVRVAQDGADAEPAVNFGALVNMARLQGWNGATFDRIRALTDADAQASVLGALLSLSRGQSFNGATWDRNRNNQDQTILASAVRAATNNSADFTNYNARGLHLVFDITAVPGVDTVTLTLQGKDALSGKYYTILAGSAQVGVATVVMRVYPGLTAAANLTANDILPRTWRVSVAHSGAGNFTYSVGASLIL